MTNEEIEPGAKILLRIMREYFDNKDNLEKFNAWKMQKEAKENG